MQISTPQTVSYKKWQSFILLNLNPLSQRDSHTLLFVRGVISQDKAPLTLLHEEDFVFLLNSPNHSLGRTNHSFCDGMDIRQLTCSPSFPAPLPKFVGSAFCLYLSRDLQRVNNWGIWYKKDLPSNKCRKFSLKSLKAHEFCVCILVMKYLLFCTVTEVTFLLTVLMSSFVKETCVWGKYIKTLNLEWK